APADEIAFGVTENTMRCTAVTEGEAPLAVELVNDVGRMLDQMPIAKLGAPQRFFGALAVFDLGDQVLLNGALDGDIAKRPAQLHIGGPGGARRGAAQHRRKR